MDARTLMIALRLAHILGGIFWVGWMMVASGFLYPAMRDTQDGGRMLERMLVHRRMSTWVSVAATLTVLSGLWMYGRVAMATDGAWMGTRPGIAYGTGGALAVAAAIVAGAVLVPTGRRLGALGARLAQGGGPPAPHDLAELRRLQARLTTTSRVATFLLVVTAALMAVARYL